jgi:hypothetical protein
VALWEKKIDKTLEKVYVPEEGVLKLIADTPFPDNIGINRSFYLCERRSNKF